VSLTEFGPLYYRSFDRLRSLFVQVIGTGKSPVRVFRNKRTNPGLERKMSQFDEIYLFNRHCTVGCLCYLRRATRVFGWEFRE